MTEPDVPFKPVYLQFEFSDDNWITAVVNAQDDTITVAEEQFHNFTVCYHSQASLESAQTRFKDFLEYKIVTDQFPRDMSDK